MATLTESLPSLPDKSAPTPLARAPRPLAAWLIPLTLAVASAAVTARQIHVGGFRSTDEARHGMNGVFLLDMVREGGWRQPRQFGERYYSRYPCISIPYNHPPLFHACEAVVYAVCGFSPTTARLSVLLFHVASVCLFYQLVRGHTDRPTGALAAVLFATAPVVLTYSQRTFLEPAMVFFMLLATWLLLKYGREPKRFWATCWLLAVLAAILTKQTAAIIVPVHVAYLIARFGRQLFEHPGLKLLVLLALVGLVGLAYLTVQHSTYQMRTLTTGTIEGRLSAQHVFRYPSLLPRHLGWPHLAAAGLGAAVLITGRLKELRPEAVLFLTWGVVFWVATIVLNDQGAARYMYPWIPVWAWLGAVGLAAARRQMGGGLAGWAALAAFFIPVAIRGSETNPPIMEGMRQAAQFVADRPGGATVLVDGEWDGEFVFWMRKYDPQRRIVLRGSKVLYTFASYKTIGFRAFAETEEQILDVLRRYGTHYVVVENHDEQATVSGSRLRQLVRGERFERLAHIPLVDSQGALGSTHLDVYYFREAPEPTAASLELQFPGLNQSITAPLLRSSAWPSPP